MLWGEDKESHRLLLKFGVPRQLGGGLAWNEAGTYDDHIRQCNRLLLIHFQVEDLHQCNKQHVTYSLYMYITNIQ